MLEKIEALFNEQIRPALGAHGGGVEIVKLEDNKLYVKLSGGCQGCRGARMTIKTGIERLIKEKFPTITEVIDATDHGTRCC